MSVWLWRTAERRVGVVGLYNAGKTVFLTSLINHLEHHDADRFRIGDSNEAVTIRKFHTVPVTAGWQPFNYIGSRDALVNGGRWPAKTRDRAEFACQFERSDWMFNDARLRFFDFPGERLADAAMLGRDYAAWSDHWHHIADNDTPQRLCSQPFLDLCLKAGATETELVTAYRLALATTISAPNYKPFVSPSTFLLDTQGQLARGETPQEVMQNRYAGLNELSQFCPLPSTIRTANPTLTALFAEHYARYQIEVVTPYIRALKSCHSLIVIVDVLTLLSAGVGMCNDNRQILRDLFDVLDPGEQFYQKVGRTLSEALLQHRPGWINRVAFVAPKIDLVPPQDRDRVLHLLKRFVGKIAEDKDGLQYDFFTCSAICSTKVLVGSDSERAMVGVPYRNADGQKIPPGAEQRFTTSRVPDEWPHNWKAGEYVFPEVYPMVPALKAYPPQQIALDRVLNFVMD